MVCHFNGKTSAFQPTTLPSILLQILIQKSEKKTKMDLNYHYDTTTFFFCLGLFLLFLYAKVIHNGKHEYCMIVQTLT